MCRAGRWGSLVTPARWPRPKPSDKVMLSTVTVSNVSLFCRSQNSIYILFPRASSTCDARAQVSESPKEAAVPLARTSRILSLSTIAYTTLIQRRARSRSRVWGVSDPPMAACDPSTQLSVVVMSTVEAVIEEAAECACAICFHRPGHRPTFLWPARCIHPPTHRRQHTCMGMRG
jgi:hypothetical protein